MFLKLLVPFLILNYSFLSSEEPWGKDADLMGTRTSLSNTSSPCATPLLGNFAEVMIGFHQNIISPADGPRSSYIPSSSQYTLEAMRRYGFFKGLSMGCDRLMRENGEEWVYRTIIAPDGSLMKWDPVP